MTEKQERVQSSGCHLSASSSVASLLCGRTGLTHWADAGDRLLEEEEEQKFFWDLVREAPSRDMSSLAVAFRMLLSHMTVGQKRTSLGGKPNSKTTNCASFTWTGLCCAKHDRVAFDY